MATKSYKIVKVQQSKNLEEKRKLGDSSASLATVGFILALLPLICSVFGWIISWIPIIKWLGTFVGLFSFWFYLLGVILCAKARSKAKKANGMGKASKGRSLGTAGLVIGIIGLVFHIISIVLTILLICFLGFIGFVIAAVILIGYLMSMSGASAIALLVALI